MSEVVVAENVRRRYGDALAVADVSLTISRGEVVSLVGPNGAGKTTLVRALTGTTDAEGTVELFGQSPQSVDSNRIGLLPQEFVPPERLTVRELVGYYAGLYEDARDVEDVLADVGMVDDANVRYENLSGGQQRRTCVGATLVSRPDLLFLDEPTTGIDPAGRRVLWELLADLADSGVTILLTTHYMEEAHQLADRVGLLANGELVDIDTPTSLVDRYGGEDRLTVTTTGTYDQSVGERFDQRVDVTDDELTIYGVGPEAVGTMAERLADAGVRYDGLTWAEPDLETVYLNVTERLDHDPERARGSVHEGENTERQRGTDRGISDGSIDPAGDSSDDELRDGTDEKAVASGGSR